MVNVHVELTIQRKLIHRIRPISSIRDPKGHKSPLDFRDPKGHKSPLDFRDPKGHKSPPPGRLPETQRSNVTPATSDDHVCDAGPFT